MTRAITRTRFVQTPGGPGDYVIEIHRGSTRFSIGRVVRDGTQWRAWAIGMNQWSICYGTRRDAVSHLPSFERHIMDTYYVAVVTATTQWFDGPLTADAAGKMADQYNADPYRNAAVIGVRS